MKIIKMFIEFKVIYRVYVIFIKILMILKKKEIKKKLLKIKFVSIKNFI